MLMAWGPWKRPPCCQIGKPCRYGFKFNIMLFLPETVSDLLEMRNRCAFAAVGLKFHKLAVFADRSETCQVGNFASGMFHGGTFGCKYL